MVADINPTPNPGNGDTFLMDSSPSHLTVFAGLLYFSATDGIHGRELWAYDGTNAQMVLDINPGAYGSEVSELTVFNGALYLSADDGYNPGLGSLQPEVFALAATPILPLRLSGRLLPATGNFLLTLASADESPLIPAQLSRVQVFCSADPLAPTEQWQPLTNQLVLQNGRIEIPDLSVSNRARCFFRATLSP
jgi:ELWxxDGT repeat protein